MSKNFSYDCDHIPHHEPLKFSQNLRLMFFIKNPVITEQF